VGTLLTPADMALLGLGNVSVSASNLLRPSPQASDVLLSVTPSAAFGYDGCLIFRLLQDGGDGGFSSWRVQREHRMEGGSSAASPPAVLQYLTPGAAQFSGACTAAPPALPWMLPMLFVPDPVPFRIVPSNVYPPAMPPV
jgi:hypothetical protein